MALTHDPALQKMTFSEWLQRRKDDEKRRTHGAEAVNDSALYAVEYAIDRLCFGGTFRHIPLYFIPDDLTKSHSEATGLYGYGCIMLKRAYYEAHGIDDSVINTIFHEMVHAYCDRKGIADTDGSRHLEAFAEACRDHGGTCEYESAVYGFDLAALTAENMRSVKASAKKGA